MAELLIKLDSYSGDESKCFIQFEKLYRRFIGVTGIARNEQTNSLQ